MAKQICEGMIDFSHLHKLYEYSQNTIYVPTKEVYDIDTFNLPKGLWLLQIRWYFYASNPKWAVDSWYRLGDTLTAGNYKNILDYKCKEDNDYYQGVAVYETSGSTVHVNVYSAATESATFNIAYFNIYGARIR